MSQDRGPRLKTYSLAELGLVAKRGGAREGAGRKTKSKTGEPMKSRAMRWTDAGWADVLLIGMDRVRELVAKEAAKVRKQQGNE